MLPSRINKEKKSPSCDFTAINYCAIVLLALSVVCSVILIAINIIALNDSQSIGNNEIRYLFLVQVENESEISSPKDFDASIIDGGVIKVLTNNPYFVEDIGVLPSGISLNSDEEILFRFFEYLGVFGWKYISNDEEIYIFCRNS